jgi:hypothetical protein
VLGTPLPPRAAFPRDYGRAILNLDLDQPAVSTSTRKGALS